LKRELDFDFVPLLCHKSVGFSIWNSGNLRTLTRVFPSALASDCVFFNVFFLQKNGVEFSRLVRYKRNWT
jgi:hypothetical protein